MHALRQTEKEPLDDAAGGDGGFDGDWLGGFPVG